MYDYNKEIADAAKSYCLAREDHSLERTEETSNIVGRAYDKLTWMIMAEKFGWNPDEY